VKHEQIPTLTQYAWTFVGRWYKWGGDDPSGFDCSGLVIELLKAGGVIGESVDMSAHGLYTSTIFTSVPLPKEGCLVFFGTKTKVIHVGYCISDTLMIEASGGGKFVQCEEDAEYYNAFIKVRPIKRRSDIVGYVRLWS
jgi:cell wall-associated NlpC family hydrolase